MKLATLSSPDARDGILCIVNRELTHFVRADSIAKTLQIALENWKTVESALQQLSNQLNTGLIQGTPFDPALFLSPLPRAYNWSDGSAFVNHVALVRQARNAEMPDNFWTDPLMYQGGSDRFLAPTEPIYVTDEAFGVDFEAEVAIITDDVPMGVSAEAAKKHIKLLMLVNDVSLRNLIPSEINKGFGFYQSKPASSFSPIALTPDELGDKWHNGRLYLPLISTLNGKNFGKPNAGIDMTFSFEQLIAHAAKTRSLQAGSIIGSGTVSNTDRSNGSSCIVEKRMLEILGTGEAKTPYMQYNDNIRIEMFNEQGCSLFGAIDQIVKPYQPMEDN